MEDKAVRGNRSTVPSYFIVDESRLKQLRALGLVPETLYVYLASKIEQPHTKDLKGRDRHTKFKVKDFCARWDLNDRAYRRARRKLEDLGLWHGRDLELDLLVLNPEDLHQLLELPGSDVPQLPADSSPELPDRIDRNRTELTAFDQSCPQTVKVDHDAIAETNTAQAIDSDRKNDKTYKTSNTLKNKEREKISTKIPSQIEQRESSQELSISLQPQRSGDSSEAQLTTLTQESEGLKTSSSQEVQHFAWDKFSAPGDDPDFFDFVVRRTAQLPKPPADARCVAEGWIRKQGHILWPEYLAWKNRAPSTPAAAPSTVSQPFPDLPQETVEKRFERYRSMWRVATCQPGIRNAIAANPEWGIGVDKNGVFWLEQDSTDTITSS